MDKVVKNANRNNIKLVTKNIIKSSASVTAKEFNSNMKREFVLEGLDCVNCAAKIEEKVSKIEGINFANVNFPTKMLT